MAEEEKTQKQETPVRETPVDVARILVFLSGTCCVSNCWDSESGIFYEKISNADGSISWRKLATPIPRKLNAPMLELFKKYAVNVSRTKLYCMTAQKLEALFFKELNIH